MNEQADRDDRQPEDASAISPLPGEAGIPNVAERQRLSISKKGLLAVSLLLLSLVVVAAFTIQRFASSGKKPEDEASKLVSNRPAATSTEPRRLEVPLPAAAASTPAANPRIPAIVPTAEEMAEPIGVRRTGAGAPAGGNSKVVPPEDAPVLLVSTRPGVLVGGTGSTVRGNEAAPTAPAEAPASDPRDPIANTARNLQAYQRQLQGLMETLTRTTAAATGQATGQAPTGALLGGPPGAGTPLAAPQSPGAGLFGGQLQGSATPRVAASVLGNRSLTLPKGAAFTCALKTKVISAVSGLVGCQVQRNVYSDDGRVLLIERGSHLDGEYRIASVRPGTVRIPVLWTRIRTPLGVTVDIESPGTGKLGESGIDGGQPLGRAHRCSDAAVADRRLGQADHPEPSQRVERRHDRAAFDDGQHQQTRREGAGKHHQHPAADLPEPGRHRRHLRRARRGLLVGVRAGAGFSRHAGAHAMTAATDARLAQAVDDFFADPGPQWGGDSTSVVEFLRPLREQLDAEGVLEVCVNRPGELLVETVRGWRVVSAPDMTQERCLSLATAVATFCDQQVNQERPLLSATLPSGERIQFVIPPAVTRGTVSITVRKPSHLIKRLEDFERDGLFERTATVTRTASSELLPFEQELVSLKDAGRYAEFLRLAVRKHQTIVVSGKTGSGKTTFMKGLVEEVPKHERLITIQDTAELTLPNHPNVVHLFYSKDAQGTARVTAKSLLEACLRMKPDRIFLAEVRGDECFYFVRLAASGHPGSITSVHAGSCALALEQMSLMIRESGAGGGLRMDEIKWLLGVVIDVIVQFDRDERGRFISELFYEPRRQRLGRWDESQGERR
jgi:type IV secretion system protein VirB11